MAQTTPAGRVKADHGNKKDLVEKLKALATDDLWINRLNGGKSFTGISNSKLVRLHSVLSDVKQRFGSRDKLIDAVIAAQGRGKDADYKKHFAEWPLPRLLDALRSAEKRSKGAKGASAGAGATAAKPAAAPKAEAKPAAAKKGTAKAEAKPAAEGGAKKGAAKKGTAKAAEGAAEAKPTAKKGTAKKGAAKA